MKKAAAGVWMGAIVVCCIIMAWASAFANEPCQMRVARESVSGHETIRMTDCLAREWKMDIQRAVDHPDTDYALFYTIPLLPMSGSDPIESFGVPVPSLQKIIYSETVHGRDAVRKRIREFMHLASQKRNVQ